MDTLILTLIGPEGHRHPLTREVLGDAGQPHDLIPHLLAMAEEAGDHDTDPAARHPACDYEAEVAHAASGAVLYLLRYQ